MLSTFHLFVVALVAFLLFGNRLPSIMKSLGQSINEFKRGFDDIEPKH